jgi:hypothetical protein
MMPKPRINPRRVADVTGPLHNITLENMLISFGLLLVGAIITFATTWYWFDKTATAKAAELAVTAKQQIAESAALQDAALKNRVAELEVQLSLVRQAVVPISAAFQAVLIKELTHFHTPVMDKLMEKLGPPFTLTEAEEKELIAALAVRAKDMGDKMSQSERNAATMLPFIMQRVRVQTQVQARLLAEGKTDNTRHLRVVTIYEPSSADEKDAERQVLKENEGPSAPKTPAPLR